MARGNRTLLTFLVLMSVDRGAAAGIAQGRVLHFPTDRSLGQVKIQDVNTPRIILDFHHWCTEEDTNWELLGEATGDVVVPSGSRAALFVSPGGWRDLSGLSRLQPDDLYKLSIEGPYPSGPMPGDDVMPHIAQLGGLKVLMLERTCITTAGLRHLHSLTALERLTFSTALTDAGLAEIVRLPSLKGLYLREHSLTNAGLAPLAQLDRLEELELYGGQLGDAALAPIVALPSLQYLLLAGDYWTDAGMVHLEKSPSIRILHLGHLRQLTDAALAHLSRMPRLERLSLHWNQNIADAGIGHLTQCESLRMLDIGNSQVTDQGLADLAKIQSLEYLALPSGRRTPAGLEHPITDKGLVHLAQLHRLRHLSVGVVSNGCPITDEGVKAIGGLQSLEELSVGGEGISDAGMEHVARLTRLRELMLFGCPKIGDAGLEKLTTLRSLKSLYIHSTDVTVGGLSQLGALPNLTDLNAHHIRRGDSTLNLTKLAKIEKLALFFRPRGPDVFTDADLAGLEGLRHLQWLQVGPRDFTDAGIAYLASLTNMERLGIGGEAMTDDALLHLGRMARLDHLTIDDSRITDEGLRRLEGLKTLSFLRITSRNPLSGAAQGHFRQAMPNLYTFQVDLKADKAQPLQRPRPATPGCSPVSRPSLVQSGVP